MIPQLGTWVYTIVSYNSHNNVVGKLECQLNYKLIIQKLDLSLDACSFRHLHNLSQRGKNNSCLTTKFRNSQNSNFPVNKMTGENYLLKF